MNTSTNLTPKQQAFAEYVSQGHNPTDAYRLAYNAKNMANATIKQEAYVLVHRPDITTTIEALKASQTYEFYVHRGQLLRDAYTVYERSMEPVPEYKDGEPTGNYKFSPQAASNALRLIADIQGDITRQSKTDINVEHNVAIKGLDLDELRALASRELAIEGEVIGVDDSP